MVKWYFENWWKIIVRPIYFYTKLKEENWQENPLTFLLISSWILAFAATLAIFIIQYFPIGSTLVEGITGFKFIVILPVLLTLAFVFFMLTFLILGGLLALGFGVGFYLIGFLLHYVYLFLGGKGYLGRMIQGTFYSSAILFMGIFPVIFSIMTRYGLLDFSLFRVGYNLVYVLTLIYVYGLWAVAGRKVYQLPRWK
ncbi:MAG: hypothetical protein ACPL4K_06175, partial [Candidatus Margulisiibacteriota bacterium]